MRLKRIVFSVALLVISITLAAQQKASDQDKQQPVPEEQAMVQRIYEAQVTGSDSDFYEAHEDFMSFLEAHQDWDKYYRTWMNRVIYDVNHKHFHRAFIEINHIAEDIEKRHHEQYLYIANMGLGFFYNARNQPEVGEKYFRRALQGVDRKKDMVAVFNSYLSLAQSLSFKRPADAMACLDSLPRQMLQNPMYESGVLGYRCIIANKMGDRKAFDVYFAKYDSIRQNLPEQFNATNLHQVMVCHSLIQKDYQCALAWCDSIDIPLTATELRINVLRGYARIFNNPDFLLKPEERPKRYSDILAAARSIESLMDPMLDSFAHGTTGITDEEKLICWDALRSPLLTLISSSEVIIDGDGQIPHDEYMELRNGVCRDAYNVATSTHQLILFSLYGDDFPISKQDIISLNEVARSILSSYDLHHSSVEQNRTLATEFKTEVADDVIVTVSPLLQELLNCLLDNAGKYATGGIVLMSCHACEDGTNAISVTNEGPVIPAVDAERIFEPFVRLSANEHSLGIGLALARRLAISMGYSLTLDTAYTQGSRFVVSGI